MGPLLFPLFARSSQAATTAANSFFDGGLPVAVRHSRSSDEALAGVTASPVAQATRPNSTKNATPRMSNTPEIDEIPAPTLLDRVGFRQLFPDVSHSFQQRAADDGCSGDQLFRRVR